ncbi:DUF72 domain-containing protein [Mucilaginibacter gotjawali]|uniref:Uncharacterized protein n=2 Tax=Mucilaginibacter gotjawali TaxID=1550579 RepID=A0A110B0D2_9SPHI|nr:DUF72 domain-containing protein [Mucilaginibacter gotjawali]MBB3057865.1 uncharacterized protein YecE (DUF72 family) [Mucilaginibacter gotjawali]BAU52363.1 hypothetical protein MgSA37_00518 [Mucilaginibacter gotjawali]
MTHQFYGGTSGLLLAMPKRDFPPEHHDKSRLAFYALHQNSIEINSSFYKLPRAKTISRWVAEVPDQFLFTFKLWKGITHQKELLFNNNDVTRFMEAISSANEKRGCLLIQFPPGLQANAKPQLQELLKSVKAYDWRAAVEFRHPSWYRDSIFELLNAYQAAMVIQDMPKSATPLELTADALVYLRFHGPSGNYKGSYSEAFLSEYANYIAEWQQEGRAVFCYFNNTAGAALQNLNFLKHCLTQISPG